MKKTFVRLGEVLMKDLGYEGKWLLIGKPATGKLKPIRQATRWEALILEALWQAKYALHKAKWFLYFEWPWLLALGMLLAAAALGLHLRAGR